MRHFHQMGINENMIFRFFDIEYWLKTLFSSNAWKPENAFCLFLVSDGNCIFLFRWIWKNAFSWLSELEQNAFSGLTELKKMHFRKNRNIVKLLSVNSWTLKCISCTYNFIDGFIDFQSTGFIGPAILAAILAPPATMDDPDPLDHIPLLEQQTLEHDVRGVGLRTARACKRARKEALKEVSSQTKDWSLQPYAVYFLLYYFFNKSTLD